MRAPVRRTKEAKSTRQRWKTGAVVSVRLEDGRLAYGRLLERPYILFYDLASSELVSVKEVLEAKRLWTLSVMQYAVTKGVFPIIGSFELEPELLTQPEFFIQDSFTNRFYVRTAHGRRRPATFEEVKGLECAAAWDPEHIVSRLSDHFAGKPNIWAQLLAPKKLPPVPVSSPESSRKRREPQ